MKPIVIESTKFLSFISVFARFDVAGISLFPFIIVKNKNNRALINHESIHFYQAKELYVVGFYILYLYYYLRLRVKCGDHMCAYLSSPFEMEAYHNDRNYLYLNEREKYAWKKSVKFLKENNQL